MKRLNDGDAADRVFLLTLAVRLGPPVMILLGVTEFYFWGNRLIWFLIPDLAATALIILVVNRGLAGGARAAAAILFPSAKGTPTPREYSEQEALVIRGHFAEAADCYRAIIADEPTNVEARIRLARLLETECNDSLGAEAIYLETRTLGLTPQQDWVVSNALIDQYHRNDDHARLKEELAGLSRRFRNTDAGAAARRRLKEITE